MDKVSISGETLVLSTFRSGLQALIADTRSMLDKVTGGQRFATKLPEDFKDDLPNTTRGYSWLNHGPFTDVPHAYLSHLLQDGDQDLAFFNDDGSLSWNIPALHEILNEFAGINANLMLLNYIFSDNRATQLCDQQIRNALQPRSLYNALQSMFWFTRRTKTSNLTGSDACIPAFIPPVVRDIMIEYLAGGIREVEEIFANILFSNETAALYHT